MFGEYQKVGVTACSDGISTSNKKDVENLIIALRELSLEPVVSEYIYIKNGFFQGTAQQRANALMDFYRSNDILNIFDISGGDIANEIIPYIDFQLIKNTEKTFWGYSDLTTIINAIYAKTGRSSVLYQVRKINECKERYRDFKSYFSDWKFDLFEFPYTFVNGSHMEGVVVGGNIRCFLKLAGTEFFPDTREKILLLESLGGDISKLVTYLSQLKMLNVFENISGILLGTFSEIESKYDPCIVCDIVKQYSGNIPIAKTQYIGHGKDSYAIKIGNYYEFNR